MPLALGLLVSQPKKTKGCGSGGPLRRWGKNWAVARRGDAEAAASRARSRRRVSIRLELYLVVGAGLRRAEVGCAAWIAGKMAEEVLGLDVIGDDGKRGQIVGSSGFADHGVGVLEDLVDGHGVHFAAVVVAGFDGASEIAARGLRGEIVGDDEAGLTLHLDPGEIGHRDPDRTAVDGESDVGRVGVTRGDGDDSSLPGAMERFRGPAIIDGEVFVHGK